MRSEPHRQEPRWRCSALPAIVVTLLSVVCTTSDGAAPNSDAPIRRDGVEVLRGATSPPTTPIRDGVVVASGSFLLADPLPALDGTAGNDPEEDWQAWVIVTGDPSIVLVEYAEQASALGLGVRYPECRTVQDPMLGGLPGLTCHSTSTDAAGRSYSLDYTAAPRSTGRGPMSHLWLTYQGRADGVRAFPRTPTGATELPAAPLALALGVRSASDWAWGALPEVGQPFEPGTPNNPGMPIATGSRLVAPAGVPNDSGNVVHAAALVRVDGDLDAVVREYERLGNATNVRRRSRTVDAVRVLSSSWTNGDTYRLTSSRQPGRPTWLLVEHLSGD